MAPRKKKDEAVETPDIGTPPEGTGNAPVEAPEAEAKPTKASKTEITVKYRDHKGEPTERTFSKEVHGDKFAELAEEFKATNASRIIA